MRNTRSPVKKIFCALSNCSKPWCNSSSPKEWPTALASSCLVNSSARAPLNARATALVNSAKRAAALTGAAFSAMARTGEIFPIGTATGSTTVLLASFGSDSLCASGLPCEVRRGVSGVAVACTTAAGDSGAAAVVGGGSSPRAASSGCGCGCGGGPLASWSSNGTSWVDSSSISLSAAVGGRDLTAGSDSFDLSSASSPARSGGDLGKLSLSSSISSSSSSDTAGSGWAAGISSSCVIPGTKSAGSAGFASCVNAAGVAEAGEMPPARKSTLRAMVEVATVEHPSRLAWLPLRLSRIAFNSVACNSKWSVP
mmetsp:Transcript_110381/g.285376  ORF Transcript_110381/g.285376 Transcript_110381/m.285376 type:complete len:312 (+) Transcript_110381:170-1105(+)